jgi:hypothetical protein
LVIDAFAEKMTIQSFYYPVRLGFVKEARMSLSRRNVKKVRRTKFWRENVEGRYNTACRETNEIRGGNVPTRLTTEVERRLRVAPSDKSGSGELDQAGDDFFLQ